MKLWQRPAVGIYFRNSIIPADFTHDGFIMIDMESVFQLAYESSISKFDGFPDLSYDLDRFNSKDQRFRGKRQKQFCSSDNSSFNKEFISKEIARLAKELDNYFEELYVIADGKKIFLPAATMNGHTRNPFSDYTDHPELDLSHKKLISKDGQNSLVVKEKYSGKKSFLHQ